MRKHIPKGCVFANTLQKIILLICFFAFFSCSPTKRMDRLLVRHYGDVTTTPLKKKSDYMAIQSNLVSKEAKPSQTEKGKRKFLPLLVYYRSDFSNVVTLNTNIALSNLDATVLSYANSKKLREKLNGRKVELFIDSIPHKFEIEDKGWMVFLLLYHVSSDDITINPEAQNLVVPYKIWNGNDVEKTGTLTVRNNAMVKRQKFLQFTNKWIHDYLDGYDEHIKMMSRELVDELILEL